MLGSSSPPMDFLMKERTLGTPGKEAFDCYSIDPQFNRITGAAFAVHPRKSFDPLSTLPQPTAGLEQGSG